MKGSDTGMYGFMMFTRYGRQMVESVGDDVRRQLQKKKGKRRREVIDGVLGARGITPDPETHGRLKFQVFDVLEFLALKGEARKVVDDAGRAWFFKG